MGGCCRQQLARRHVPLYQPRRLIQHLGSLTQQKAHPLQFVVQGCRERPARKGLMVQGQLGPRHVAWALLPRQHSRPADQVMGKGRLPPQPPGQHAWPHAERGCRWQAAGGHRGWPRGTAAHAGRAHTLSRRALRCRRPCAQPIPRGTCHHKRQRKVSTRAVSRPSKRRVGKVPPAGDMPASAGGGRAKAWPQPR